ncbi:MAG TPA: AAA family ATPase, partial [Candidatus Limnocylindrales bacterium]|nr:AAA family ATPase [Candidatus Limnocylindrales bacterium]
MALTSPSAARASGVLSALIERDEPLAALAGYLDEAAAGSGRFVVIRGEAGIGKTALLGEFLRSCPADVTILSGACDGVSTPQPFGPLEDMVAALGPELRALLDADARRAEVGRWLLDRLSGDAVHVLAIDDVQSADEATLELLAWLARRLESLRLLVVVTLREGEGSESSVARMVGAVASLPSVRHLSLIPLTRAGVARLAAGRPVDLDELHRITAGNPFYASEVLTGETDDPDAIPVSILDAVRARVARLDARGQRALQAAAIIGVRAEPWLLAAIAGEDLVGIDDSLRVGLLTKSDGLAFRHELTRRAVLEDLPVIHGIALHRLALAALERAGIGDSARLAYHAEGAADRAAVLRHAAAAGRRALAVGALNEAAEQFRRALESADGRPADERAELVESLARVLFLLNHLAEAVELGREAVAIRRQTGDTVMASIDLSVLALAAWTNGRGDEAWQAAREAVALVASSGDSHALALAHATLGRLGLSAGRLDEGRAMSERAVEIGRRIDDPESTAIGLATIGTIDILEGDLAGFASLEESLQIGRRADLPPIVDRALNNMGVSSFTLGRMHDAESWYEEMERHSERSEIERCGIDTPRAEIALALGNWDAAATHARAAFVAPRTDPVDRALGMLVLARLGIRRGEPGWEAWTTEPSEFERRLETSQLRWPIAAVLAEHAWLEGDVDPILPGLREAYAEACAAGD